MKPSPSLCTRLRFSTKDVGKGFYRGNRTGSMGAHTPKGGYLIDYRKVRSYNVPDLSDKSFKLTPYMTSMVNSKETVQPNYEDDRTRAYRAQDPNLPRRERALQYLDEWKLSNPEEYRSWVELQRDSLDDQVRNREEQVMEAIERLRRY